MQTYDLKLMQVWFNVYQAKIGSIASFEVILLQSY
jgi:hypothetical protein